MNLCLILILFNIQKLANPLIQFWTLLMEPRDYVNLPKLWSELLKLVWFSAEVLEAQS